MTTTSLGGRSIFQSDYFADVGLEPIGSVSHFRTPEIEAKRRIQISSTAHIGPSEIACSLTINEKFLDFVERLEKTAVTPVVAKRPVIPLDLAILLRLTKLNDSMRIPNCPPNQGLPP
jgi:hypothetical protein